MAVNFNCDCTDELGDAYETLAALRRRMLIRLGFAVQADNPPPGMATLVDEFLQSAQRVLYHKHKELRTERFFTWDMEEGDRLFDLYDNTEECTKKLDPLKVTWVGIEDATGDENGTWTPLDKGIPPEYYTTITSFGMPSCYEIRQCIEVFPPADRPYRLRIKGHFGQMPFIAGTDRTTIDSELVFLWALSNAKAHYNKPDAGNVRAEAVAMLGDLKAGRHLTARYIPGAAPVVNLAKPIFLGLEE